jgi:hypothetical protein
MGALGTATRIFHGALIVQVALFWIAALVLYAAITQWGRGRGIIPVVSQLAAATFILPPVLTLVVGPVAHLTGHDLIAPAWLHTLYSLCFALLLGSILADVADMRISATSVRIALPSFLVPLVAGIVTATLMMPALNGPATVAVGLLFSITAIPVLYLYLQGIDYPAEDTRRLMHAAILMDMSCWTVFALSQGAAHPLSLAWPLGAGLAPLVMRHILRVRAPWVYGLAFLVIIFTLDHYKLNTLVFGVVYMGCINVLRQPFALPAPRAAITAFQNGIAVPLILTYGIAQIDFTQAFIGFTWTRLACLLAVPVAAKLLGNWLGLKWAVPAMAPTQRWRETLLLNIRGVTEIVFLNLLFQQRIIDATLYFSIMLMGLGATLLPGLTSAARAARAPNLRADTLA